MGEISTSIRVLMLSNKESQRELANAIGMTEQNFSNKLNGRHRFSVEDLRRIFQHYELTPDEIYSIFME